MNAAFIAKFVSSDVREVSWLIENSRVPCRRIPSLCFVCKYRRVLGVRGMAASKRKWAACAASCCVRFTRAWNGKNAFDLLRSGPKQFWGTHKVQASFTCYDLTPLSISLSVFHLSSAILQVYRSNYVTGGKLTVPELNAGVYMLERHFSFWGTVVVVLMACFSFCSSVISENVNRAPGSHCFFFSALKIDAIFSLGWFRSSQFAS